MSDLVTRDVARSTLMTETVNPMLSDKVRFVEKVRMYIRWRHGRRLQLAAARKKLLTRLDDPEWCEEFPGRAKRSRDRLEEYEREDARILEGFRVVPMEVQSAALKVMQEHGIEILDG